nr:PREDICTED: uncharacterized protein LOC108212368 [Daucus carota subsp. sativus]
MDRSWLRADRRSREYQLGVEELLMFASEHGCNAEKLSCPCLKCAHTKSWKAQTVRNHLFQHGIDETYTRWIWHGETNLAGTPSLDATDSTGSDGHVYRAMDGGDEDYYSSSDSSDFINHVQSEQEPLYPGCESHTRLRALVKLYNLKAKHDMSDSCFSEVLILLGSMLPEGNTIPSSFNEAKKTLCLLGMGYEKIHVCPNDCLLYRGERDEDEIVCRICKASRWKLNKKGEELEGVPAKVLCEKKDGKLRHPADSKTWKDVDQKWPEFASETRNLRLALSSDGFNPFHGNRTDHSTWPVLLSIYNLPPWLCMKKRYIMFCLLISGPTESGNDIDVYLQPLLEDLQELWNGKQVYDAYKKEFFMLRGILLWTISDYPALGCLSGNVTKGYNACTICVDQTNATRLVNYRKTVVMRHRRWLPRQHPYRRQKSAFDNTVEKGVAPIPLTGEQVFERVQHLRSHVFGKKQRQPRWKKGEPRPIWKKVSIFFQLEYWKFLPVRHCLDVMHIEKNICEALVGTLLNIPGKTKDRESVRLDMAEMGIRTELRPKTPGKKEKLEKHFPPSFFDVMIHLSIHLVREVELCGPIFLRWMYPFERYMKTFKGYVRNPARPEGCIAEGYCAEEAVQCLVDLEDTTGLHQDTKHNEDIICRPLSGATIIKPNSKELHLAHLCVLQNINDVRPYLDEHMAHLMMRFPQHENDEHWLKNKQNDEFPKWLQKKSKSELVDDKNKVTKEIMWIAEGPNKDVPTFSGYKINGVTYSTKERDDKRQVQGSGVCVAAHTMIVQSKGMDIQHTSHTYYGVITSIWELDYNEFRVPIFHCNWVDMNRGVKVDDLGYTLVNLQKLGYVNDPFVLGKHVKQVCYIDDPLEKMWSVVLRLPDKNYYDQSDDENEGCVEIELENELDVRMFPTVDEHEEQKL